MHIVARGNKPRKPQHLKRWIGDHILSLIAPVKSEIISRWSRGVTIRHLAKEYGLTVLQTEAVIWEKKRDLATPPSIGIPTVRESRGLHVVSRRVAA